MTPVLAVIFLVLQQLCSGQNVVIPGYETHWFTQNITHFDPQNTDTWQQRFLLNTSWFDFDDLSQSTIFFYAGNEGAVDAFWNNTGLMFEWAPKYKAVVVAMEHRYYGESHPYGDDFSASAMRYLTFEDAIGDFAVFMTWFSTTYLKNAAGIKIPVVVFGGSYGGILATLLRVHYPHLFDIALAASAPIPQTLALSSATIFFELVTQDYQNVDARCPMTVRSGFAELISNGQHGNWQRIKDTFRLCDGPGYPPMESMQNVTYLELWARNALLTMAMVDYPYAADFLGSLPAWPVNYTCLEILLAQQYRNLSMEALAAAAGFYYNASAMNTLQCHNYTAEYMYCSDQTGCGLGTDSIAWDYQMCTQVACPMTSNNVTDMFPPRVWEQPQLIEYCVPKYGVLPDTQWVRIWFPANVQKVGSNIIFSNGLLDPWRGGGYMSNLSATMPAVVIPWAAHHLDLRGSHEGDPDAVVKARALEDQYISEWIVNVRSQNKVHFV